MDLKAMKYLEEFRQKKKEFWKTITCRTKTQPTFGI